MNANKIRERKCEECGAIFAFEVKSGIPGPWVCEPCRTMPKKPQDYETVSITRLTRGQRLRFGLGRGGRR